MVMILFTFYFLTEVLRILSSTWLRFWTDQSTLTSYKPGYYIVIYALLGFSQVRESLSAANRWSALIFIYTSDSSYNESLY